MVTERVAAGVSGVPLRAHIGLWLTTAALATAVFAGCASVGAPGAVSGSAGESNDRLVWDCGWRTLP